MGEARRLSMLARLIAVQRAKRGGAEVALADARRGEQAARAAEHAAAEEARSAQEQWLASLAEPGFSPEYSRLLARHLIDGTASAEQAAIATRGAAERHAQCRQEWQRREAHVRSNEASLAGRRRAARRRHDERELGEAADATTFGWTRR